MESNFPSPNQPEQIRENESYFHAVLRYGLSCGLFGEADVSKLQLGLYALLSDETARYTMGDSSSIPVETAKSLYRSICFCLGLRLRQAGGLVDAAQLILETPLAALFLEGRSQVRLEFERGKTLLAELQRAPFRTGNLAYLSTCHEALPEFFRRYDFWHGTHDIPCMIDYPLVFPVAGEGVSFINAYLGKLLLETRFLLAFEPPAVARLLRGHCPEPDEALINLFEPVYCNAMGRALLKKDIRPLNIRKPDRAALWRLVGDRSEEYLRILLQQAGERIRMELTPNAALQVFLEAAQKELLARLLFVHDEEALCGIFTSFPEPKQERARVLYRKRKPMADEALRELIEELRDMRFLADKLALLQRAVRSLEDWMEIIPLCFEEAELPEAFLLLSNEELVAILSRLNSRYQERPAEAPELWEAAFARFLTALPTERQKQVRLLAQADWKE